MTKKTRINRICSRTILSILIANIFAFPTCYAHQVLVDKINFEKSEETIDTNNDRITVIINSEHQSYFGKINIKKINFTGVEHAESDKFQQWNNPEGKKIIALVGLPGETTFIADELNISGIYGKTNFTIPEGPDGDNCYTLNLYGLYAEGDDVSIQNININHISTKDSTTIQENSYPVATGIYVPDVDDNNNYSFTSTGEINISSISSGESRGLWLSSTDRSSIKINQININNINGSAVAAGITAYENKPHSAHDPIKTRFQERNATPVIIRG